MLNVCELTPWSGFILREAITTVPLLWNSLSVSAAEAEGYLCEFLEFSFILVFAWLISWTKFLISLSRSFQLVFSSLIS